MTRLSEFIHVNTSYTRSINIERDATVGALLRPFVLTGRAHQTLSRIVQAIQSKDAPRAWAMIGPYGSGKSAFALFLASLLGDPASEASKRANAIVRDSDKDLAQSFQAISRGGRGFLSVLITGSPEPLARRVVGALASAAEARFGGRRGKPPQILKQLRAAFTEADLTTTKVLALLKGLQNAVKETDGRGIILVVDELGKFLEYEARHGGTSDIFLLQTLAEHSVEVPEAPVVVVALLHQSFEIYAQKLGEKLKNEWSKVAGRFEAIPYLETAEQTIRIIRAAIKQKIPAPRAREVRASTERIARTLKEVGAIPSGIPFEEFSELIFQCYPLHPVSLLLLPTLCQKVAQNERTLFSYLGSREPHGFLESLARLEIDTKNDLPWIRPADIYEYFILSQPALSVDQGTHRRWVEVLSALDRIGDEPEAVTDLLKTIGLLNIAGIQSGLKASDAILKLCVAAGQKSDSYESTLKKLQDKSAVAFRRFSGEYRVWQGSDFDLEAELTVQRAQLGKIEIAEVLNEQNALPPIVARRHTIATGTLRYLTPIFVPKGSIYSLHAKSIPTLFVCIVERHEDIVAFRKGLARATASHSVGVIYESGDALSEAVLDVLALRRVQRGSQELANDPVAQRELKDRLSSAIRHQQSLVGTILDEPEKYEWAIGGLSTRVSGRRQFQERVSAQLTAVYSKAPRIRNELVNRDKPSSSAIAGRKKLFMAMLDHADKPDLGIEKFPAEKAMYRAILKASKIHTEVDGAWGFREPPTGKGDVANIRPAWDAVITMLDHSHTAPVRISEVNAFLVREPYGMKEGVLPILVLAIYQALSKEIALCEGGQFVPFLTQEILEGLLKTPEAFTLQRFQLDAVQRAVFQCYTEVLTGSDRIEPSLVAMLQPLAKLLNSLPDYTKRTRRMSADAIALRDLFFAAKEPLQYVFEDLPRAFGFSFALNKQLRDQLAAFSERFKGAIAELKVAYHGVLSEFTEMTRSAFVLDQRLQLHELRETLRGRCHGLEGFTIDQLGLKAFIGRIQDDFGDDSQWLISLATFLARKPPEKWTDDDVQVVRFRLSELVSRLNDLRHLQLHYERGREVGGKDFEAALIRLVSTGKGESEALVTLDKRTKELVVDRVGEIRTILDALPTPETKLAALVSILNEVLRPVATSDETDEVTQNNKIA